MPTHRPRSRAVILLLALLSAVVLGAGQEATCEMHGGMAAGSIAGGRHHGAGAHVPLTSHDRHGHHDRGSGQQEPHGCRCTCLGDCSATAAVATLPAATTIRVATIAAQSRRSTELPTSDAAPTRAERRLPFPNGPPATRLS
jgi:hypothetical protein